MKQRFFKLSTRSASKHTAVSYFVHVQPKNIISRRVAAPSTSSLRASCLECKRTQSMVELWSKHIATLAIAANLYGHLPADQDHMNWITLLL